jgi:hypothetical protein
VLSAAAAVAAEASGGIVPCVEDAVPTGEFVVVGETDVIAAFKGATTAAISGGNVCASKRASQK